jgi:hypothetical protein
MHNEKAFPALLRLGEVCLTALMTIVVGANSYVTLCRGHLQQERSVHPASRGIYLSDTRANRIYALMQERVACALGQLGRPGTLQALWQLAMCEFALEHIADVASSPKQLQLEFRAACEEVRHPDEVPRLHGSNSIYALMDAFHDSKLLRDEVLHQLGGAVITAVDEYDVPVANIDYC